MLVLYIMDLGHPTSSLMLDTSIVDQFKYMEPLHRKLVDVLACQHIHKTIRMYFGCKDVA
jgi:hypothetical protein